jgi:PAS domain S-box-containing protein
MNKLNLMSELPKSTIRGAVESTHAELTSQSKNQQITKIWESVTDAYVCIDSDWRIVYSNPAATLIILQLVGLTPEEFLGKTHWEIFPRSVGKTVEREYRRIFIEQLAVHFEFLYEPTQRWFDIHVYPSVEGFGIYFRDITERKQNDEKLWWIQELNRRILESHEDCIKVVDLEGHLIYMNDNGQKLMEVDDFAAIEQTQWLEFWQGSSAESAKIAFTKAKAGETGRFNGYCPTIKGVPKWWEVTVTPLLDLDGNVEQILSVSRDITERRITESILEERNQQLDSFVCVVSHDLKAPLRAISNLSQWIEDDSEGSLSESNQQYMNLLRSRIRKMEATIDGLLDYARIGKVADSSELIVIEQLLTEVIDSIAPPPTFKIDIATNMPTLSAKKILLFQVFSNLIGNSIKHHNRLDGSVTISVQEQQNFYEFIISDDGPGIAPEDRERVFTIFQAVNPQNRADSTGIGLAIVKKIIQDRGGDIRLESEVGVGTTLYFTWPIDSPT